MLHLPFPLVNVLTKIDNLSKTAEPLPFNLDFYTEVQDLEYLLPHLEAEQNNTTVAKLLEKVDDSDPDSDPLDFPETKFTALNRALIQLLSDFGIIGFETLAVEDKNSMMNLLHAIDRASGYVFGTERGTNESVWGIAMQEGWGGKIDVRDVQERWIDRREEFDDIERKMWEEEARRDGPPPATEVTRTGEPERGEEESGVGGEKGGELEDDEDLEAMQEAFLRDKEKNESSGVRVVRKS